MIYLRDITKSNWYQIINLKTTEEQEHYVASNVFSLAQAYCEPECKPFAIYKDFIPVGFCMYCMDEIDNEYWIYRLMIDGRFQSKGYGREAMKLLLDKIKEDNEHHVVYISFEPENIRAKALYESLGFIQDGRIIEEEIVYKYEY
jgi:diamine N-acetyltransferase